jgi:AbiV family abortive infection protein
MTYNKELFIVAIKKSLQNAEELISEAKILKEHNCIPRAYTLNQLGIEEIGKASMIHNFLLFEDFKNPKSQKEFLKKIINHTEKTDSSIQMDLVFAIVIKNKEIQQSLIKSITNQRQILKELNHNKNNALYVSFIDSNVYLPSEIINEKMLENIEFIASIRISVAKQYFEIILKEFDETLKRIKREPIREIEKKAEKMLDRHFKNQKTSIIKHTHEK